jgi:hypothetical protein
MLHSIVRQNHIRAKALRITDCSRSISANDYRTIAAQRYKTWFITDGFGTRPRAHSLWRIDNCAAIPAADDCDFKTTPCQRVNQCNDNGRLACATDSDSANNDYRRFAVGWGVDKKTFAPDVDHSAD